MAGSTRGLAVMVLGVSLPLAMYALICACIGERRGTMWAAPAALLVMAAIGLAVGSRFWQLAGLWTLAGALPYVLWLAYRVWRAGPKESTLYPLLDRYHQVPHLPVLIGLVCAAALLALALVVLARATRQATVA